jgi:hypothetical protein
MHPEKAIAVATKTGGSDNVLRQFYNDDWSVRPDIHPFMSEIAHLAVHRGIRQEGLAKLYNKAAGTRVIGANVSRHFDKDPHRRGWQKVIDGYTKAFKLSRKYVRLLLALNGSEPALLPSKQGSRDELHRFIDFHLEPRLVRPLFRNDGLASALTELLNDEFLAIECVNAAELAWQRHTAFELEVKSELAPKIVTLRETGSGQGFEEWEWDPSSPRDHWHGTGIQKEQIVKWDEVARILKRRCNYDLFAKSRKRLEVETSLVDVFAIVRDWVEWTDWLAIQAQLEAIYSRKGLPIEEMRARLNAYLPFDEWADDNDPIRANYLQEQMNARETLDIK